MLSKPIASGIMLTAIIVLGGGALLQQDSADEQARIAAAVPEPETQTAPERTASAPNRVVDSAGFPVVPDSGVDADVAATRPVVTINGRPINGAPDIGPVQAAPEAVAETPAPAADEAYAPEAGQVAAVIEPPRPIPRPEGLVAPQRQQAIDYEAIAAIAYGEEPVAVDTGEFMSFEERQALTAPQAREEYLAPDDPRRQGLVAVVGPNGEPIWIYEEQVRAGAATNSGVTFSTRRVQSNPFGFVYEDYYGW